MKMLALVATTMISFGIVSSAAADGAALYAAKGCTGCHGVNGISVIPTYPSLAGQNSAYTAQQIKDIRDGKRTNGASAIMKGVVTGMSNADIEAIATYLQGIK